MSRITSSRWGILEAIASGILDRTNAGPLEDEIRNALDHVVRSQPGAADQLFASLPTRPTVRKQRDLLLAASILTSFAGDLAANFLLLLELRLDPGARAVLKYSYEEQFRTASNSEATEELVFDKRTHRSPDRANRVLTFFNLKPTPLMVRLPSVAMSQSFHVEVNAPDELLVASAALMTVDGNLAEVHDSEVAVQRTHLRFADRRRGTVGALVVNWSLHPSGLVTVMLLIAGITFALFIAGIIARVVLGWHSSADATVAVLIILPAIFASYLIRPGEHRLVRRLATAYKWIAASLTCASLAVAASMAADGLGR